MKKSDLLIILGGVLMVSALVLLFHSNHQIAKQKAAAIALEEEFSKEMKGGAAQAPEPQPAQEGAAPPNAPAEGVEADEEFYYETDDELMDRRSAIGVLRINDLGVVLPIYDNTSSQALWRGTGVVETTDLPSTEPNTLTVLAGHRGGRAENLSFMHINKLPKGAEIIVTTADEILYYEVYGQEVVEPMDWSRFIREEDKNKLYLMTCHPYPRNNKRLLVKAELVGVEEQ